MALLTIGIPTYNGAPTIRESLVSIADQLAEDGELTSAVEILISDNASIDQTPEIIARFQAEHPHLSMTYHRQPENLGYDRNVDTLFQLACGDYVWTFADDDVQNAGAILRVVQALKQHPDLDVVLANFVFCDPEMSRTVNTLELNDGQDALCKDGGEFLRLSRERYCSVSSLVIRRSVWQKTEISSDVGRNFIHAQKLLRALPHCQSYIIAEPQFRARGESENFERCGDDMIHVPLEFLKLCCAVRSSYSPAAVNPVIQQQKKYIVRRLRAASRRGLRDRGNVFRSLLPYHYDYLPFWINAVHLLR